LVLTKESAHNVHPWKVVEGAQGLCTVIEKVLKEADSIICGRSRDLQSALLLLHNDPVNHTPITIDAVFLPVFF